MLKEYKKKRNFRNTPEPAGRKQSSGKHLRFVVQRHDATRLHYDFRLELDGVLKSWAVPKGPSMNPADKRLAVQVEDHPVDYIDFAGVIPEGNYGAGVVQVWDHGNYIPVNAEIEPISEKEALKWLKNGEIKFVIKGEKLSGEFVLVRLRDEKNWLLIKHNDEYAVKTKYDAEKLIKGKSKKEVFAKGAKGEKVWQSNRSSRSASGTGSATTRSKTSAVKESAAVKKAAGAKTKKATKAKTKKAAPNQPVPSRSRPRE
jgi:bifunctional non-homologous end joining protein LigD